MSAVYLTGANLGNGLQELLMAGDLTPGDEPSYQLCKNIFLLHPFGRKMAEAPTAMAQSQKREITVSRSPGEHCREAFEEEWKQLKVDRNIFNTSRQSRIYGVASIAILVEGEKTDVPLDLAKIAAKGISFNVFDPLNTSGSLVLNQNPNEVDFQKNLGITVQGQHYDSTRAVTLFNEDPIYISYTSSAFGFSGRSVYQRALFPLKTFVQTMVTDDLVSLKVGVLIAKIKQAGAIINQGIKTLFGLKRNVVQEARTGNVISIGPDDSIESINMQNLDGPAKLSRDNAIKNIATAADMPAWMLENETMVAGFGEGTEDAKNIAKFIDRHREELEPVYEWFDQIVMYRAWTPEFFETMRKMYPAEYGKVKYETAFYQWKNSFKAVWPSLLTEPDSEKAKTADVKLKAVIALLEVLLPVLDPDNSGKLIDWAQRNINELDFLFNDKLDLDAQDFIDYIPTMKAMALNANQEPDEPKPESAAA